MSEQKKEYPKWKYHESKKPIVVESKEEEMRLESGWGDTPAAHGQDQNQTGADLIEAEKAGRPPGSAGPGEKGAHTVTTGTDAKHGIHASEGVRTGQHPDVDPGAHHAHAADAQGLRTADGKPKSGR